MQVKFILTYNTESYITEGLKKISINILKKMKTVLLLLNKKKIQFKYLLYDLINVKSLSEDNVVNDKTYFIIKFHQIFR